MDRRDSDSLYINTGPPKILGGPDRHRHSAISVFTEIHQ